MSLSKARTVSKTVKSKFFSEGQGVIVRRTIGMPSLSNLDPFLLLDEFKNENPDDYIAGFPDHPHRGFETVTYMLEGNMEHEDNKGNKGTLTPGSVQWMTAGKGVVHSEMPKQDKGRMWGFQLWVNLPSSHKMMNPRYQDIPPEDIPVTKNEDGVQIKVISGSYEGVKGPVKDIITDPLYFDINVPSGKRFSLPVTEGHTLFAYPFENNGTFGNEYVSEGTLVIFNDDGQKIEVKADENEHVRFLLVGGKPLKEPIARRGPFVMNTDEEIVQAFMDYYHGKF